MTFIESIKNSSNEITLKKIGAPIPELLITDQPCLNIAFLDVETTGLDKKNNEIIELAIKTIKVEKLSAKIVSIEGEYESFNDPNIDIPSEITSLTGISNTMVKDEKINWQRIDQLITESDIIIAHNAGFDRSFIDRYSLISAKKIWACSVNDIDWLKRGFTSSKQELLCYWHGFYFEPHRAMNDVDALINLLTHRYYKNHRPLHELIENCTKSSYTIFAENFPYNQEKKDIIKGYKYKWNPDIKIWYKNIKHNELEIEKEKLTSAIYDKIFRGRIEKIDPRDKYKSL